jgi:hypothetical protein
MTFYVEKRNTFTNYCLYAYVVEVCIYNSYRARQVDVKKNQKKNENERKKNTNEVVKK